MGEKRKPILTILLRFEGKKKGQKVEIFPANLFKDAKKNQEYWFNPYNRYRIRVNGRWWPKGENQYFVQSKLKEIFWRSLKL